QQCDASGPRVQLLHPADMHRRCRRHRSKSPRERTQQLWLDNGDARSADRHCQCSGKSPRTCFGRHLCRWRLGVRRKQLPVVPDEDEPL
ncbi:hypothetical protein OC845_005000, partial [Tilletia horrida]